MHVWCFELSFEGALEDSSKEMMGDSKESVIGVREPFLYILAIPAYPPHARCEVMLLTVGHSPLQCCAANANAFDSAAWVRDRYHRIIYKRNQT